MLIRWIKGLAVRGFPISKWALLDSVDQLSKELHLDSKFPGNKPGMKWLQLFLGRHPSISERVVEKLTKIRACVTESDIRNWFSETRQYLEKNKFLDILEDPNSVQPG